MKTHPGLFPARLAAAALVAAVILAAGCASKPHRLTRAPSPTPPSAGADEILRRQNVAARTRELLNTGKYKSLDAARSAAERQYPPVPSAAETTWSTEYAQWEKQKAEQAKFESDFAKSMRQP